jgi:hypothetical protein
MRVKNKDKRNKLEELKKKNLSEERKETETMIVASIHVPCPVFCVRPIPYSLKKIRLLQFRMQQYIAERYDCIINQN